MNEAIAVRIVAMESDIVANAFVAQSTGRERDGVAKSTRIMLATAEANAGKFTRFANDVICMQ